jgi:hypothetical protein
VHEVDAAPGGAPPRLVVQQPQPPLAQQRRDLHHVVDPVRHLLQTGPGPVEEPRQGRVGRHRSQQLQLGVTLADGQHGLTYPLLVVDLLVDTTQPERAGVERQRLVHVGDGDPDVVDSGEQGGGHGNHDGIVAADGRRREWV